MDRRTIAHFATFGFVILRQAFDPEPLAGELDAALATGLPGRTAPLTSEEAGIRFHYLPMMGERTPISLDLVDRFATVAEAIIERPVLPVRAKGTRYWSRPQWHAALDALGACAAAEAEEAAARSRTGRS